MKKFISVAVLGVLISAGSVFADHPGSLGIGFGWQGGSAFDKFNFGNGVSVFLKAPVIPIYWGISFDLGSEGIGLGLTGDSYIIDATIVPDVNFGWFLGVGGYGQVEIFKSYTGLGVGARVPIGVYIIPVSFLEIFLDIAPRIGLSMGFAKGGDAKFDLGLGWQTDFGFRFWL